LRTVTADLFLVVGSRLLPGRWSVGPVLADGGMITAMPVSCPVVLLPVKPPARGKSRLHTWGPEVRRELARAFALDTLHAVLATPRVHRVVVLTTDPEVTETVRAPRVHVVVDAAPGDLNGSLTAAAVSMADDEHAVALCADLPSLRPDDLARALELLPADRAAFVADAAGSGTTTYAAPTGLFAPRFGEGSAHAHRTTGAVELTGALSTLRADVDDEAALQRARRLGVGAHTARVLTRT